jgi:ParB family chromosome partitioning protein
MVKKRGLARGLDALLGGGKVTKTEVPAEAVAVKEEAVTAVKEHPSENDQRVLPVEFLQRGRYQPRRNFDENKLQELADSIKAQGMVQPIVVRSVGDKSYEIIAGERRWRAAQLAGLAEVPVFIREVDDQTAMAMALIENIQRDDLNPLEEAVALHRLLDEFGLTHQEIANAVGKSRTTVTNLMRLLELAPEVKALVDERKMDMGHARALLALKAGDQRKAANEVVRKGLSVRATEALVKALLNPKPAVSKKAESSYDSDTRRLLDDLTDRLGAKVDLKQSGKGKGTLQISFNSLDELEGILEHIK